MKKIISALLVCLMFLYIVGCSGSDDTAPTVKQERPVIEPAEDTSKETIVKDGLGTEEPETSPKVEVPEDTSKPKLSDEFMELIKSEQKSPNSVVVRPTSIKAKVGDDIVYGVGFFNVESDNREYIIDNIKFVRGTDTYNNAVLADAEYMDNWIKTTRFTNVELEPYEASEIIPLFFKVGDKITESKETIPGTYEFDITINEVINDYDQTKKFEVKRVYIRVIE